MKKFFAVSLLMMISLQASETRSWGQAFTDLLQGGGATAIACVSPVLGGLALAKSAQIGVDSIKGDMDISKALAAAGIIGATSYGCYLGYRGREYLINKMTEPEQPYAITVSNCAFTGSLLVGGFVLIKGVGKAFAG